MPSMQPINQQQSAANQSVDVEHAINDINAANAINAADAANAANAVNAVEVSRLHACGPHRVTEQITGTSISTVAL